MITNYGHELRRFPVNLLYNGNAYYIQRVAELEDALADVPKQLQLELVGDGEIDLDLALLFRDVLRQRSPETRLITCARSSLRNGSVLVWLLGDRRTIREDAHLFFRRATVTEEPDDESEDASEDGTPKYSDSYSEADPEETDQAQVLHYINEFLPVRELAGCIIDVRMIRQFGLIETDKLDQFLATTLGSAPKSAEQKPDVIKPANEKVAVPQPAQE
jgi:hypothetical protein